MNQSKLPLFLCLLCCAIGTPSQAAEFVISIIDSATRQPVAARVYVENVDTAKRHFVRAHSTTDGVIYERQNWANARSRGQTVELGFGDAKGNRRVERFHGRGLE